MAKLLVFAPCQKVIVDQQDQSISLIAIISGFTVSTAEHEAIPAAAAFPTPWSVFVLWKREPRDEGKSYEQKLHMISPSGATVMEMIAPFQFESFHHRVRSDIVGFPIAEAGQYGLELSLREAGTAAWHTISQYDMTVDHSEIRSKQPVSNPSVRNP